MVKQCGYFPGYCINPGRCDLNVNGWPSPVRWYKITKAAANCEWRVGKSKTGLKLAYRLLRRRDWKVGNPYE